MKLKTGATAADAHVVLFDANKVPSKISNRAFVSEKVRNGESGFQYNDGKQTVYYVGIKPNKVRSSYTEQCRISASGVCDLLNASKAKKASLQSFLDKERTLGFVEGVALTNYQFLKYFSDAKKRKNTLSELIVNQKDVSTEDLDLLLAGVEGTYTARDLVNEPLSFLTAVQFSKEMKKLGKDAGFTVETFNKKKIESLKMGGLLAVNQGSIDPPTFNILEYKPAKSVNKKPYALVGKGVVYDTGGLSLKPTPNSMDFMKCDMGGAAALVGAMVAIAQAKLPIHVVGFISATDNRPSGNAYAPGDVIHMFNGSSVEVLNTDAEGRLVMADALAYAQKYKPEFTIDLATLTGAAARAIGGQGVVTMGTADQKLHDKLKASGDRTYERVAQFPFWEEYGDQLKSDIADLKNLGGPDAGMITAGKFLEHFTKKDGEHAYPWIHIDIAGPSYAFKRTNYRGVQGTGVGVRLLYDFFSELAGG